MRDVPSAVVGEGQIEVFVYVRFVTKCFGSNISIELCVVGSGFSVVSNLCIGGFCREGPPHRPHMCSMWGS